ncbi:MAG: hypothetical protein IKU11_04790, partial [Clostridia bacterium]|nr:hypothetical protein [Clostridia bacterium]
DEGLILMGLMLIFVGTPIAWLSSLVLYGFGELVEKATLIHEVLSGETEHTAPQKNLTAEEKDRIAKEKIRTAREKNAKKLFDQGLITEEQYKKIIGK